MLSVDVKCFCVRFENDNGINNDNHAVYEHINMSFLRCLGSLVKFQVRSFQWPPHVSCLRNGRQNDCLEWNEVEGANRRKTRVKLVSALTICFHPRTRSDPAIYARHTVSVLRLHSLREQYTTISNIDGGSGSIQLYPKCRTFLQIVISKMRHYYMA